MASRAHKKRGRPVPTSGERLWLGRMARMVRGGPHTPSGPLFPRGHRPTASYPYHLRPPGPPKAPSRKERPGPCRTPRPRGLRNDPLWDDVDRRRRFGGDRVGALIHTPGMWDIPLRLTSPDGASHDVSADLRWDPSADLPIRLGVVLEEPVDPTDDGWTAMVSSTGMTLDRLYVTSRMQAFPRPSGPHALTFTVSHAHIGGDEPVSSARMYFPDAKIGFDARRRVPFDEGHSNNYTELTLGALQIALSPVDGGKSPGIEVLLRSGQPMPTTDIAAAANSISDLVSIATGCRIPWLRIETEHWTRLQAAMHVLGPRHLIDVRGCIPGLWSGRLRYC